MTEPGLRERKKLRTREQLAATAARMFLERGFEAVRVAEVAAACGVSTKTVFNYFPTKEALVLDRLEDTTAALQAGLADPSRPPLDAALALLSALAGAAAENAVQSIDFYTEVLYNPPEAWSAVASDGSCGTTDHFTSTVNASATPTSHPFVPKPMRSTFRSSSPQLFHASPITTPSPTGSSHVDQAITSPGAFP